MRRIFRAILLTAALTLVACGGSAAGTPSSASPNPVEVTISAPTVAAAPAAPAQTQAKPRFIDFYATW